MDKRVSPENPCPICGKPDWCMYSSDGTAAICTRISEGSIKKCKNDAGWLHKLKDDFKPKPVRKKRPVQINWDVLQKCYSNLNNKPDWPDDIGVRAWVLHVMNIGKDGEAFTFPVRNAEDEIIGISRRFPDGRKGMVKGSQVGIFIPRLNWDNLETLFICEGVSDTATALDIGLRAIGRLNCGTGKDHIIKFCAKKRPQRIGIIADNDEAGIRGAKLLGREICHGYKLFTIPMPDLKVVIPPDDIGDFRAWRADGLTVEKLLEIVDKKLDFDG